MPPNDNTPTSDFEKGVLDYIRKSNAGSSKAGFGPISIRSKQEGNEDLAKALLSVRKMSAGDSFEPLNKLGKSILEKMTEIAEESILADASTQKQSLEQIKVLKELLPLVEEGTEEQKRSKKDLMKFIGQTEKGLTKNTTFKNRLIELTKAVLPSAAGIVSAIGAKSPLIGAAVNFGLEKLQERSERKDALQKDSVKNLISMIGNVDPSASGGFDKNKVPEVSFSDHFSDEDEKDDRRSSPLERFDPDKPVPVKIVADESLAPSASDKSKEGTIEDFYLGVVDALKAAGADPDVIAEALAQTKKAVEEITNNDPEKIKEFLNQMVHNTKEDGEILERISDTLDGNEESKREDQFQMEKQNAILEKIADNSEVARTTTENTTNNSSGRNTLSDRILQMLGLKAGLSGFSKAFSILKGIPAGLTKLKGYFGGISKFVMRLPGVGLLGKVVSKIISFPVQFGLATINGIKNGVSSFMKGEGIGTALKKTLFGFSNWFLAGFLGKVQNWVSENKFIGAVTAPIFGSMKKLGEMFDDSYDALKRGAIGIKNLFVKPGEGFKKIKDAVSGYWDDSLKSVKSFMSDPKSFIAGKFVNMKQSVGKFFMSLIPSWVPIRFLPESIRDEVRKSRYGGDKVSKQDQQTRQSVDPKGLGDYFFPEKPAERAAATQASAAQKESSSPPGAVRSTSDKDLVGRLLKREGGFVNDPTDRGGATNFGITRKTLSDSRGSEASVDDVRNLTEDEARKIYEEKYLSPFQNVKDDLLKEFLFDSSVQHGTGRVQAWKKEVELEGGTEQEMLDKLISKRAQFYKDIIANDPSQKKYEKGWKNRLAEFQEKAKDSRADELFKVDQQIAEKEKAEMKAAKGTSVAANVSNKTTNNSSNTHVSRKSPTNQDPSARFYSPSLATA